MRTTIDHKVVEHPDWKLAPPKVTIPWDHIPRSPFRTQAWYETPYGRALAAAAQTHDTFDEAMRTMTDIFIPVDTGVIAMLLDETFSAVFIVDGRAQTLGNLGTVGWTGCRAAFEWLEQTGEFDMMDLAVWEGQAMRRAINVDWDYDTTTD